jgi:hypothetical protein
LYNLDASTREKLVMRRNEKRVKGSCIGEDDSDEDEEDNKERDDGKGDENSDWGEEHDKTLY